MPTNESDILTVSRFVLRARRVAAHSMAMDREALRAQMNFKITGHLSLDGTTSIRRQLPDEEAFESLAARVRPVLLKKEPIYYGKVLDALERLVTGQASSMGLPEYIEEGYFDRLRAAWERVDLNGRDTLAFLMQSAPRDGSVPTANASDIQLAAAWLYADLVHADAQGAKEDGLAFPVKTRYVAAVTVFSRFALLTLVTFDVIKRLHDDGILQLHAQSLSDEVTVAANELIEEGTVYIAPGDAAIPDIQQDVGSAPGGWRALTVTGLLRLNPANHVDVTLEAADGKTVAHYDAAVSRRFHEGDELHWEMLVAGVLMITVAFQVADEVAVGARLVGMETHASTNQLRLAEARLQVEMSRTAAMKISIHGEPFFELASEPQDDEVVAAAEVAVDTLGDLVALEDMLGDPLDVLTGSYSAFDRIRLRQTRLLLEGNVIPLTVGPLTVTAARGTVPQAVVTSAESFVLGEQTHVPLPARVIRHPLMEATEVVEVPDSDPPADRVTMSVPVPEPFLAWIPDLVAVNTDAQLLTPHPLQLTHLKDDRLFNAWQGHITASLAPPAPADTP